MSRALRRHAPPAFLDPEALARIDNLELVARTVVDGFIQGLHRSPYLGLSVDFAEHRPYNPGDDIRRIDWRLWARTDRYHVKQFEAETNTNFMTLLDVSASMDYASRGISKLDYARFLAACLTYFSSRQRDRVGLVTFDRGVLDYVPPSARHRDVVLHALDRVRPPTDAAAPAGSTSAAPAPAVPTRTPASPAPAPAAGVGAEPPLAAAVDHVADRVRRRGIAVLISDFYEEPDTAVAAVRRLRDRGSDVIVFHVLDPAEIEFPFDQATRFQDLETGAILPVVPETMRARYRQLVDAHIARLARRFAEERIDYALFDTATPLDHALFTYLSKRQHRARRR